MIIEIKKDELDKIKESTKEFGSFGGNSTLYGKSFKYFNNMNVDLLRTIEPTLWNLANFKVEGVALPIDIVYCDEELVGYTKPFYQGIIVADYLKNIKSTDSIEVEKYLDDILNKLYDLANLGISTYDVSAKNLVYSNGNMCLFDCDFYFYSPDRAPEEAYQKSLAYFLLSVEHDQGTIKSFTKATKNRTIEYVGAHPYNVLKKSREK